MKAQTVTDPAVGCSPEFPGRVIAALAKDPERHAALGRHLHHRRTRAEYGVTDIDGKVIPSLRAERGAPIWSPV